MNDDALDQLIRLSACQVADLLAAGDLKPSELVAASQRRIEAVDGALNALPVRCFERACEQARTMERSAHRTLLGGIPIVVKDNNDVGGVGTSGGTPIFRDRVAAVSDRTIARLERNGAIPVAKANLSELGGANTTNRVFGATRNPWDRALTCGGSSGGSAVAVATGQAWLAHGNDVGGSLRIPPAFAGIVGLRPTPGRVARKAEREPFDTIMVDGPIARSIEDLALMFDAMTGFDAGDPLSAPSPDGPFRGAARQPAHPGRMAGGTGGTGRIAWSAAPGGLPVDDRVRATCEQAIGRIARAGARIETTAIDLDGIPDTIRALRGDAYARTWEPLFDTRRGDFTASVAGDIERGRHQSGLALRDAQRRRDAFVGRTLALLADHDFLIVPATQAMPFAVESDYPTRIGNTELHDYLDWIMIDYVWSLTGCPVLALPAGRAENGLPVGLQVVGRPRGEYALFRFGAWLERELWHDGDAQSTWPAPLIDPRPGRRPQRPLPGDGLRPGPRRRD